MSAYVTSNPVDRYLCPSPPPTPFTTTNVSDLFPVTLNSLSHILLSSIRSVKERERTLPLTHLDEMNKFIPHSPMTVQHPKNYQKQYWNGIVRLHGTINESSFGNAHYEWRTRLISHVMLKILVCIVHTSGITLISRYYQTTILETQHGC